MVQALRRQRCRTIQEHRRQCRSGGRGGMKSGFGTLLGLTLLAGYLAAAPASAGDPEQVCDVPANLLSTESSLPKVADAVRSGQPLNLLVIGSRSSSIPSSEESAYPAKLQAALKESLPSTTVNLSVEVQGA